MKRATFVKATLSAMVAVAATFGGGSAFAQGKVIRMIPGGDLKIIDPIQNASYISRNHGYMVYDTLFSVDSKGQVKPQMIDTYTLSPDKKTYTFTLRQGLKWHDGAPVTAADCVASIKRWGAKDVSGTLVMRELASLDVVNGRTFTLTLKAPFGLVIDALGKPSSNVPFMMPERIAKTDPNQQITDATGSGPFIFKKDEWVPGNKVVYVKNPNYVPRNEPADGLAGGKVVKVDRVEWIYIPDQNTALAALTKGEADIFELPQADFDGTHVRPVDQWGHATTQIFSEVSPAMHEEFAIRYESRWLANFGHNYDGCCEPLHKRIKIIKRLPNLRRVSVSPRSAALRQRVSPCGSREKATTTAKERGT